MASIEKGAFYLLIAKIVFFLSGYALLFVLGRFVLSPAEFGIFGVVLSIISLVNIILISGIEQSVSKFVSETPAKAKAILRQALKIQLVFSLAIFLLLFLSADYIAFLLNDPRIAFYLRVSAFVPLLQPFFAAMTGYLNGLKDFRRQAIFTILYRTLRAGFPILLALAGLSLFGAFAGISLAALVALAACAAFVGIGMPEHFPKKKLVLFSAPIILYILLQNSFLSLDLLFLKALVFGENSSLFAGYYTAAQTLAIGPLELATTLSIVLFPLVSETVYTGKKEKSLFYIRNAYRYAFIIVAPLSAIAIANAPALITLVYGMPYAPGASALAILSLAFVFFTIFIISETIISAKGSPHKAMLFALIAVIADIALLLALVPALGLDGAAIASTISMAFGCLISTAYVFRHFRAFPFKSTAKTIVACIALVVASAFIPATGLLMIAKYVFLLAVFLAAMVLLGEIKKADIRLAARMAL